MTYWDNVNEAICGNMAQGGRWYRAHRIKLWRYRARAAYGGGNHSTRKRLNEYRQRMAAKAKGDGT